MAAIAVTYTFSNSTTADATQVNQNFTDIVNGLSDGTKDISVNAGTFAGNVSISGNTTIGNASGDDLTVTASLASSIPIKTTNSFDIGSSSLGLRALFFGANSQTVKIQGSSSMSATWTLTLPVTAGTDGYYLKTNGSGVTSWQVFTAPTIQTFTSGSGTYSTPAGVKWLKVRMVGGGGGGGPSGTGGGSAGTGGGATTFGSSLLTANGGSGGGGISTTTGASGGSATVSSPAYGTGLAGGAGGGGSTNGVSGASIVSGHGGSTIFGGGGSGSYSTTGGNASSNTGGGGGGGGGSTPNGFYTGVGGGSGAYVEAFISGPSSTYSYAIGSGGAGGGAGSSGFSGGNGAAGYIEVTEYYQ
jgi:hypothetical protein